MNCRTKVYEKGASERFRIVADLHTHTLASNDAFSTVREIISAARDRGLKIIGITDHGPALPFAPHRSHFEVMKMMLPEEADGVKLLKGVEANILDKWGSLDISFDVAKKLDIVIAGFHEMAIPSRGEAENTRALIGAIRSSLVDVIAHPDNPRYPVNLKAVVEAAALAGVALEINNGSFLGTRPGAYENCRKMIQLARERGVRLCVSSDAHIYCRVGVFDKVLELVRDLELTEEEILNTSVERVLSFLKERQEVRRSARE